MPACRGGSGGAGGERKRGGAAVMLVICDCEDSPNSPPPSHEPLVCLRVSSHILFADYTHTGDGHLTHRVQPRPDQKIAEVESGNSCAPVQRYRCIFSVVAASDATAASWEAYSRRRQSAAPTTSFGQEAESWRQPKSFHVWLPQGSFPPYGGGEICSHEGGKCGVQQVATRGRRGSATRPDAWLHWCDCSKGRWASVRCRAKAEGTGIGSRCTSGR